MTERAERVLDPFHMRNAEWTQLSHRLERFELFMAIFTQNLGHRDHDLSVREYEYARNRAAGRASEDSVDLTKLWLDACMFVMCLYEVVRSMDERIREDAELSRSPAAQICRETKQLFERVRIPLAKFQPAKRHQSTDYAVAVPGMAEDRSVAWEVADGVVISRRTLSGAFLEALRALPRRAAMSDESGASS